MAGTVSPADGAAPGPAQASPSVYAVGSLADAYAFLATAAAGLSNVEAARRLQQYGANEPRNDAPGAWLVLFGLVANPLIVLLLLAAGVSAALGDRVGSAIIAAMVVCGVALNFVLGYRSQRAAASLVQELTPMATVRRDDQWGERPRRELVPGDVIRLSAGDRVPADARLIDARDLHVQQAALTGESVPAEKVPSDAPTAAADAHAPHLVFLGTSVVAGTATALVYATGQATAFGDIADALSQRPPPTEFERGLEQFARLIMRTIVVLLVFVVLAGAALQHSSLQTLLFALALAVGLTPEFMPMITTVTLARAARRMAAQQVIVKHLSAIEDFGSMTVLLSDKTGTLTLGETAVEAAMDALGTPAPRVLALAALHSGHETGIRSPLDRAILHAAPTRDESWTKLDEIPFDFERRRACVVVGRGEERHLIVKGAPEAVLAECSQVEVADAISPIDAAQRQRCQDASDALAERGLRVLAVAWRPVPARSAYDRADETSMILAGFIAFADPVSPGVAVALAQLSSDGVALKIVTGDDERVARRVCAEVGLPLQNVLDGKQIATLSDTALASAAESATLFARVLPAQKLRIVLALKRRGHVVGFLGDGINDAPSLHAADVGISVAGAVDVARDAADIVLRRCDLQVLHAGVIEGRRAFANVTKYLLMGTSSNFGNMFSMAIGAIVLPFLPMLPTQVLLNNFLYDLAQTTIPTDNVDADALRRPQRWNVAAIRNFMLAIGPISSLYDLLTFAVLLFWLRADEALFHTGWFVESLATQTLVLLVIRTHGNPWRSRPSGALLATIFAVLLAAIALPFTRAGAWLGFVPLPPLFFVFLVLVCGTYLGVVQLAKGRFLRRVGRGLRVPGSAAG